MIAYKPSEFAGRAYATPRKKPSVDGLPENPLMPKTITKGENRAPPRRFGSIGWRLVAPIPIALAVAIGLIWFVVPRMVADNSTGEAIRASQQTAAQFKVLRAYYTENIVNKIVKDGHFKASFDHKTDDNAIPLPATFIQDLSDLLSHNDTSVSLYSKYPFPNRKDRRLDDFQEQAWNFLTANPKETFSRNEARGGRQIVRVAVADTMVAQACVNCHNSHPQSPKTDWKLGDVRGVLEVTSVIDAQLADGARFGNSMILGAALLGLVLLAIALLAARSVTKPLRSLAGGMRQLASGNFEVVLPGLGRRDEIGEIAAATEEFKVRAAEKAQREALAQAEQQRAMAATRDAAMARLSEEFEGAVGGIVAAAIAGDFSQRVALDDKSGLILNIGTAINTMCENVSKVLEELVAMLSALADGDLTQRITADYRGYFAALKQKANSTAERIGSAIGEIKQAAEQVANASAEISAGATDLSQRTEEQAASLEETAASLEQIADTVKKNAESAEQANQFAARAREVADRGGQVVAEAVDAMSRIDGSSRQVANIITVIDEIARQTNLLALNAAVEAARAGDAGRGFAVVASEVRSLAQRSAQAAKDINDLITNSSREVQGGVELVNRAGASLHEIVESIKRVTDIVADIAGASGEQSTALAEVNKALSQMDEAAQQNSALVEENAATAKTLEHQAAGMNQQVGVFRLDKAVAAGLPAAPPRSNRLAAAA
jgi:methyl-accepting chemotaxis protein